MAIAPGSHVSVSSGGTTSLTTGNITTSASGSTFVVAGASDVAPLAVPTDSKANVYLQKGTFQLAAGAAPGVYFYTCQNGTGGATHNATLTWLATDTPAFALFEITGAAASSLDATTQGSDSASPYTLSSGTLAQAAEMVVCVVTGNGSSNPATAAESTGFTIIESKLDNSSYDMFALGYKVVAATTAVTPSWTVTGSARAGLSLASFKQASGTAVIVPWPFMHGLRVH